jgi:hypothetical protein
MLMLSCPVTPFALPKCELQIPQPYMPKTIPKYAPPMFINNRSIKNCRYKEVWKVVSANHLILSFVLFITRKRQIQELEQGQAQFVVKLHQYRSALLA